MVIKPEALEMELEVVLEVIEEMLGASASEDDIHEIGVSIAHEMCKLPQMAFSAKEAYTVLRYLVEVNRSKGILPIYGEEGSKEAVDVCIISAGIIHEMAEFERNAPAYMKEFLEEATNGGQVN